MRSLALIALLGSALTAIAASPSQAAPARFDPAPAAKAPIVQVQLVCDPARCINPQTGAYTESGCNYRGCYPISGVVGYTNPGYGYGAIGTTITTTGEVRAAAKPPRPAGLRDRDPSRRRRGYLS